MTSDDYLQRGSVSSNLSILQNIPKTSQKISRKEDLYINSYGRLWGEKVTYSTGMAYGAGLFGGGLYGFLEGLRKPGMTRKLRINAILNSCTTRGPRIANPAAIMTMMYCGFNGTTQWVLGKYADYGLSAPIAGALSGALYKCSSSMKMMARYSITASVAYTLIDQLVRNME
ncbi:putative mitochondrial import inner membrane translocase subunit [Cryptosporidium serpentis]